MKKKKFIIFGVVLLVIALVLVFVFTRKLNSENKKKYNENNYTLKFDYMVDGKLDQRVTFIYADKKLKDITVTIYFDTKETAKNAYKIYKKANEFKDYKVEKNRLILYYNDKDLIAYKTYSEQEIIDEFTSDGYMQKK